MNNWSNAKLCDVANLILGGVLIVSPWLFGFSDKAAFNNAVVSGIIIAILSVAALAAFAFWEEWLNLVLGLWLLISPWAVRFAFDDRTAMQVHIMIGIIVAVLAAVELWITYRRPRPQTALR